MKRCVIVGGAFIGRYPKIRSLLFKDDYFIFCDSGLRHRENLCVAPNLIVGDFDSFEKPCCNTEIIQLPCKKDDTDTVFAIKEALRRGFEDFLLIGVCGERLDHTLGNVSALLFLDKKGIKGTIVDDYSEMEIISRETAFVTDDYNYFSLLNITGDAKDITIKNAEYPLTNAQITCEYQYGISNRPIKGMTAEIQVKEGRLLLIKIKE